MSEAEAILNDIALDEFASTPLYQQLANTMRERILTGALEVGTHLPTETALSEALGIGVSTVRNAYALLVKEGLVNRRPRRGSFVSSPHQGRQLDGLYSFTSETRRLGKEPSTQVVSFERIPADFETLRRLALPPAAEIFRIARLRLADGAAVMLETSHVPVSACPNLSEEDVHASLYDAITRISGASPAEAHEIHEVIVLDEELANVLGRNPGDPAFRILRTTINTRGERFEWCVSICPGDSTHYELTLRPDSTSVNKVQQ